MNRKTAVKPRILKLLPDQFLPPDCLDECRLCAHGCPLSRWTVRSPTDADQVEQDYRELQVELGLDHFEGLDWPDRHHPVTAVMIAFAFLRCEQLRF